MRAAEVDHQLIGMKSIDTIETVKNERIVNEVTDTTEIVNHRLKLTTKGLVGTPAMKLMVDHLKVLLQEEGRTETKKEDHIVVEELADTIIVIVDDIIILKKHLRL